jgi:hypothetical protein
MTVDQFMSYVIGLLQTLGIWPVMQAALTATFIIAASLALIRWFRG